MLPIFIDILQICYRYLIDINRLCYLFNILIGPISYAIDTLSIIFQQCYRDKPLLLLAQKHLDMISPLFLLEMISVCMYILIIPTFPRLIATGYVDKQNTNEFCAQI